MHLSKNVNQQQFVVTMLPVNYSSFRHMNSDDSMPFNMRVIFVACACMASTVGNLIILTIFIISVRKKPSSGSSRYKVVDIILAALALTAFFRGLLLGLVQSACFVRGEWAFGNSICQLEAYVDAMLRHAVGWYLSLLSIERYTKHLVPHEYLVTFSPLTVNMIIPGTLLVVIVQVTAPLYGWGKYSYIPDTGLCGLVMNSEFGCSYALYLIFSLDLPPLLIMIFTWVPIVICRNFDASKEDVNSSKRNLSSGASRFLDRDQEIITFVALVICFVVFSVPRQVLDAAVMCDSIPLPPSELFFALYFLEGCTCLVLPALCLSLNVKSRLILRSVMLKEDIGLASRNMDSIHGL